MLTLLTALSFAQAPPPIIGGQQAEPGEWPDSVVLMVGNNISFCTGTLIAPDVVLTAGHCIDSDAARYPISVRLNSVDKLSGGELISVQSKTIYPGYRTGSKLPDLAVLKLSRESTQVEPRAIMGDCITPEYGSMAPITMVGWGLAYPNARVGPQ
ncbi:MAG: secreted trypsin-like serine protease, partial [Kiritimatiellia bacterium]